MIPKLATFKLLAALAAAACAAGAPAADKADALKEGFSAPGSTARWLNNFQQGGNS